jgi:hypothetical protein
MTRNVVVTAVVAVVMAGFVLTYTALVPAVSRPAMGGMGGDAAGVPRFPAVKGFAEGQEIYFIHSEASDRKIAELLTDMMGGSPVLVVPSLANVPEQMLAPVYVFANGVKGDGPLGFQPDVFDHLPGSAEYSPLRYVHQVRWTDEGAARELRSAADVRKAQAHGEIVIARPGVVVNMPMLTWPGGRR